MQNEILKYIKKNKYIEFPSLQEKFNLSYKETKSIIDDLISNGTLVFDSGVKYSYKESSVSTSEEIENASECNKIDLETKQRLSYRDYLEKRRQELIKQLENSTKDEKDDNINSFEISDEVLRIKVLQYCFKTNQVSIARIQNYFCMGFSRACKIVFWMEKMGYISEGNSIQQRKILISQEELDKLLAKYNIEKSNETVDLSDKKDDSEKKANVVDLRPILIKCFEKGLEVKSNSENYVLKLNGKLEIEIKFVKEDDKLILSDGGKTILKTKKRYSVVEKILENFEPVTLKSDEICIDVENPDDTLMSLLILYSAIDAVVKMN